MEYLFTFIYSLKKFKSKYLYSFLNKFELASRQIDDRIFCELRLVEIYISCIVHIILEMRPILYDFAFNYIKICGANMIYHKMLHFERDTVYFSSSISFTPLMQKLIIKSNSFTIFI